MKYKFNYEHFPSAYINEYLVTNEQKGYSLNIDLDNLIQIEMYNSMFNLFSIKLYSNKYGHLSLMRQN